MVPPCCYADPDSLLNQAAKRRAVTELLFFASVGDLRRCQRIVRLWKLKVRASSLCTQAAHKPAHPPVNLCWLYKEWGMPVLLFRPLKETLARPIRPSLAAPQVADTSCCDYDKRTPLCALSASAAPQSLLSNHCSAT